MENNSPVEMALELGLQLLGKKQKIGTMFDPKYSDSTFNSLASFAKKKAIHVSAIKVDSADDAAAYIPAFEGKIDFFVAIRDVTTSQTKSSDALFAFTEKNNIPIISLDPSHKDRGALLSISVDPIQLGEQAWNVAKIILREKKIPQMPTTTFASELSLSLSLSQAKKTGLSQVQIMSFLEQSAQKGYQIQVIP